MPRVKLRPPKSEADLQALLCGGLPEGLASSFNLGTADIYPALTGKANAARYLMERFGSSPQRSCFLCDDDNDLGDLSMAETLRFDYGLFLQ